MFFTRITEWDYDDAPARPLLFTGDLPVRDQVLPKALDDADAGKFLRSAQAQPRLLVRVVAEVLIRTGVRVGEFCDLQADAIRTGHDGFWLHVPVGKLHDDRYPDVNVQRSAPARAAGTTRRELVLVDPRQWHRLPGTWRCGSRRW